MQSISDNSVGKAIPEDHCNPMEAEKINYPEICREVEKRVRNDTPRAHRLPLTKSSFAVNRVSKVYRSEVQEILKKCRKLDRMLIRRNNPEAETESIEEIISGLKSARTESNVSEESASEDTPLVQISENSEGPKSTPENHHKNSQTRINAKKTKSRSALELLSWSRGNTQENKSSNKTLPPNKEYSKANMYEGTPSMEASFKTNSSNEKKSSKVENSINETSSRRNSSRLKGYKKDNRSYLKDITTNNNLQSEGSSNNLNSELENSNIYLENYRKENSHLEISKEEERTKRVRSSPNYSTQETSSQESSSKIESRSTTKGRTETPSKVTKISKRKIGSRKRTRTSSRTIGTQTDEDPQVSIPVTLNNYESMTT
ncbi:unnamed protein product [Pieris brassicae]|uniref:Uncharacterized protein n=1 Tax=Pieris brassicae TaxID=7116 RepID=A0A9P0TUK6_PIEBR|nr:unnamed protein product [Pieris brassicae]